MERANKARPIRVNDGRTDYEGKLTTKFPLLKKPQGLSRAYIAI